MHCRALVFFYRILQFISIEHNTNITLTLTCTYVYIHIQVKKVTGAAAFFKIVHEKYRAKNMPEAFGELHEDIMNSITLNNKESGSGSGSGRGRVENVEKSNVDLLNPMRGTCGRKGCYGLVDSFMFGAVAIALYGCCHITYLEVH